MRDKAFEEAAFSLADFYGMAIAPCEICGRMPKIDFSWRGERNTRVEAYCTGGRFIKRHRRIAAAVVNGKEGTDGFYTEVIDIWNGLQMQDGYERTKVMPGRKKNND